jgi:RNA polymerase sigma factor for flagellar operon FliA
MEDPVTVREQLVIDHIPLLKHIVGRMCFDSPGSMDRDDLFGFGMLGLLAAADSWDASRGLAFSTYAYPKIRGAILDELRRWDFLPRGRREFLREVERAIDLLEQRHGQKPSPEEIASELGCTADDVDGALLAASTAVQTSLEDGPGDGLTSMLCDPRCDDPVGSVEYEELKQLLIDAIEELPEQEKSVITLYYAEELLLREIAEVLGVTESRVSQIHTRAVYRLNRTLSVLTGGAPSDTREQA